MITNCSELMRAPGILEKLPTSRPPLSSRRGGIRSTEPFASIELRHNEQTRILIYDVVEALARNSSNRSSTSQLEQGTTDGSDRRGRCGEAEDYHSP
jgi:hypothetical protein